MKKIKVFLLILVIIFLTGCNNKQVPLEDKYYHNSEIIEIDKDGYSNLIKDKENFVMFIYQPMCITSNNFEKILNDFSNEYQITIYKMPYSLVKDTSLYDTIKYYPSFVIFKNGKVIHYLDANSNEDIKYYQDINEFVKWFSEYVVLNK